MVATIAGIRQPSVPKRRRRSAYSHDTATGDVLGGRTPSHRKGCLTPTYPTQAPLESEPWAGASQPGPLTDPFLHSQRLSFSASFQFPPAGGLVLGCEGQATRGSY